MSGEPDPFLDKLRSKMQFCELIMLRGVNKYYAVEYDISLERKCGRCAMRGIDTDVRAVFEENDPWSKSELAEGDYCVMKGRPVADIALGDQQYL